MEHKTCDHTSVGMIVWKDSRLLLIERKKPPFGFAPPAGHVDADATFEEAATRELREEVGLDSTSLTLILDKDKANPCRRAEGTWHHWRVYEVYVTDTAVNRSKEETIQAGWYTRKQITNLAKRTERYSLGEISDIEWQQDAGLEKVWHEHFQDLGIL